ncbi:FabD/lysophospholipase-like protein [Piedraia hortae CBS 480.64]|uniref:FabD/lysophospholipase-like protein n=1 Tax=Piedraia hortae CBS 480.64 TaxID=1314780 RepID=A0A6A7BVY0_9PEZI|nr:FabD/lysophospholipase-like protein [Piedraia hortae CBS 480.64]
MYNTEHSSDEDSPSRKLDKRHASISSLGTAFKHFPYARSQDSGRSWRRKSSCSTGKAQAPGMWSCLGVSCGRGAYMAAEEAQPSKLLLEVEERRKSSHTPSRRQLASVLRRAETKDSYKAGRSWARSVDDPWWPCILTLDGGGIRGYSSLLILSELMHEVWLWEQQLDREEGIVREVVEKDLLPCHYFDFMYGTSTGGLIATLLGRLRMTVSESLELYRHVGNDLFGKQRSHIPLMTKYRHQPLEHAVQEVVASRCHHHTSCRGTDDPYMFETERFAEMIVQQEPLNVDEPRVCQSACLTATHDQNINKAYLLRSYPFFYPANAPNWISRYNEGADLMPMWKVTRATTAAPFYFEMVHDETNGEPKNFKDGGIRENNPSWAALSEFVAMYVDKADAPALLLSIGTGRPDQSHDGFADSFPGPLGRAPLSRKALEKLAVLSNLMIKYTEGERQHRDMRTKAEGEHTWYKRLNVDRGLEHMGLDEWKKGVYCSRKIPGGETLSRMEEATRRYLEREFDPDMDTYAPPRVMLKQAAEKIVRQRRGRERLGGERWRVFLEGWD